MKLLSLASLFALFYPLFGWCATPQVNQQNLNYQWQNSNSEISIVSYNVENLFDTEHDEGKLDYEYLPLKNLDGSTNEVKIKGCNSLSLDWRVQNCLKKDWTPQALDMKLRQISEAVRLQGDLPDILGIQEIENGSVLKRLARDLGYDTFRAIVSSSLDKRGIDNAILYRGEKLKLLASGQKNIRFERAYMESRPLLWAMFEIKANGEKLFVIVNHWPSQANPSEKRYAAAKATKKLIREAKRHVRRFHVVSIGDFNVTNFDRPHPIINYLDDGAYALKDSLVLLKKEDSKTFYRLPLGTSFYFKAAQWDYLDKILVSESLVEAKRKTKMVKDSFRILAMSEITRNFEANDPNKHSFGNITNGIPNRFNYSFTSASDAGYSDHFPIRILLKTGQ